MSVVTKVLLLAVCFIQPVFAEKSLVFSLLSLDQATKKIIESSQSKVLAASTQQVNGRRVHIIKVLTTDGRVQHIKVDVNSGEIIQ